MQHEAHPDWKDPRPLDEVSLPPWPAGLFPAAFESFIKELSRSTETPIEMSAMLVLSAIAAVVHKTYQVRVKPDYLEPINLWTMAVLPPASRKSAVFAKVTAPLREWESQQRIKMEPGIRASESQRKTMEVRLKELRQKAAKAPNDHEYQSMQIKIERLEENIPSVPILPQIWAADVTSEQLGVIMALNREGMALLSDEGGIFDILGGLYSEGRSNIDLCLQAHSASPVRVDRGSRLPLLMDRPVLTVGLTVQPHVIWTVCSSKNFRGRGLLGRFLYVFPESNIGNRIIDVESMNQGIIDEYALLVSNILKRCEVHSEAGVLTIEMTKEAFDKWLGWAKAIEIMMGEEMGFLSHITDWAGKLSGAMVRIAGLLHIMRYADQNPWEHLINVEDMKSAAEMVNVLIKHALKVFNLVQEPAEMGTARTFLRWIKSERLEMFTARDCSRRFRAIKKDPRNDGLKVLEEHEIIKGDRPLMEKGRPSEVYFVNPKLFEK